tara:strand:+ start:214 stop:351 length:138 start_codon:yes stop_codon:yes gene_type:complete
LKKKLLIRIDKKLHESIKKWATEEMRSVNSHIEFLLKKIISEKNR